jgi:SpoVK/Ycf46/Vps4 family AAA+-type ATPase
VKANGGVLIIDDFGRQRVRPRDLLNRWIVPLEKRMDFLTLHTGHKFALPFNVLVVFATNIRPSELVDDAFLRRIHNKIMAEPPTVEDFRQIFKRYCQDRELQCDEQLLDDLLAKCLRPRGAKLRGCVPRDLIDQALAHADYRGAPRELNIDLLEAACASYFVDDEGAVAS